jgi:hypothetical protein
MPLSIGFSLKIIDAIVLRAAERSREIGTLTH